MARCESCGAWRIGIFLTSGRCSRCSGGAHASTASEPLTAEEGRRSQLAAYSAPSDVLAGVRWSATMSPKTPLSSLLRHGEVFSGDPQRAPEYGSAADGIWVPEVDWDSVGLSPPSAGAMVSAIGPIPSDGGAFLPFLISFREIVEGSGPVESKIKRVREMCATSAQFSEITLIRPLEARARRCQRLHEPSVRRSRSRRNVTRITEPTRT